jgi:hypothetical protein
MNTKELRVFVLSADNINTSAYEIEEWSYWSEETLPSEALHFIKLAEENGSVYSLIGFQNAINFEEVSSENTWIFITNKY